MKREVTATRGKLLQGNEYENQNLAGNLRPPSLLAACEQSTGVIAYGPDTFRR